MWGNYLKVAARNIQKRKFYSFINAFGLSIGLAFCMLITLYIQDEKEFDQLHTNKNQIYRIEEKALIRGCTIKPIRIVNRLDTNGSCAHVKGGVAGGSICHALQ